MKKVFVLFAVLSLMLFSAGISFAAAGAGDNMPGGAGVSMFRVGTASGFYTAINIQHRQDPTYVATDLCALAHVAIYDMNSIHIIDFNLPMTLLDNVGIIITAGSTAGSLNIFDYSDFAFGGSPIINALGGTPIVASAPALASGDIVGYVTITRTNTGCLGGGNAPTGNIQNTLALAPDSLFIRTAFVSPTSAYAFNSPMFQGFVNIPTAQANSETGDFITTIGGAAAVACQANGSGGVADTLAITNLDDTNGANIDFWEQLITHLNGAAPAVATWGVTQGIVCDAGTTIYNALGAPGATVGTSQYWGRFNRDGGASTQLVLVSPNNTPRALYGRSNNLSVLSYNDQEVPVSFGPIPIPEVAIIAFGSASGNINTGTALAGEALISYNAPAFGHTYTSTASFTDLYPLVRDSAAADACDAIAHTSGVVVVPPAGVSCVVVGP